MSTGRRDDPSQWERETDLPKDIRRARRRARLRVVVRDNWYRDLWLFVISGLVVLALANAQDASDRIQGQRKASVLGNCNAQNSRHDSTVAALTAEENEAKPGGPQQIAGLFEAVGVHVSPASLKKLAVFERQQAVASIASTESLIDALAPKQICSVVLAIALGQRGATGTSGISGSLGPVGVTGRTKGSGTSVR